MTHTTSARPVATPSAAQPRLEPASPSQSDRPIDRLSWLWLAVGLALLPFSTVHAELPLAVWLAPIFALRFARTQSIRLLSHQRSRAWCCDRLRTHRGWLRLPVHARPDHPGCHGYIPSSNLARPYTAPVASPAERNPNMTDSTIAPPLPSLLWPSNATAGSASPVRTFFVATYVVAYTMWGLV